MRGGAGTASWLIAASFVLVPASSFAATAAGSANAQPAPIEQIAPPPADSAPKETLEIGISTNEIAVQSNFAGAEITIFGAIQHANPFTLALDQYDVIVTLEGPKLETTVRKKERVFGIWINRHSADFEAIPTSYSLSSTRPIGLIATQDELRRHALGADYLHLPLQSTSGNATDIVQFRQALLNLKERSGLYQSDMNGVRFVSSTLFKASVKLPASIPVGTHMVHGYLFKNGRFIAEQKLPLHIVKTGVEQYINTFSQNDAFLYGIFAVCLAGFTGWLGSVVFKKD